MATAHLTEPLLGLAGRHNKVGDGGPGQVAFGDAGRRQAHAVDVENRRTVDLTDNKDRAQCELDRLLVVLAQGVADGDADRPADQLQVILQALLLKLAGLFQTKADAQCGEHQQGQHNKQQKCALQAADAEPGKRVIFERVFFAHV